MEKTLDLFLSGNVPKEGEELRVIIEEKKGSDFTEKKIETSVNQIQMEKKKQDLKQYLMNEYSDILGGNMALN